MILDSTLVHSRPVCTFQRSRRRPKQKTLGRDIVANIVMLGALVRYTHVVSKEALK